jgi:cell division protein ZapE
MNDAGGRTAAPTPGALTPGSLYAQGVAQGRWDDDAAQRHVMAHLDRVQRELMASEDVAGARWRRLLHARPPAVRGVYLWGPVGRGKTFLVDLLFQALPSQRKLRLHFHRFMGRVHAELGKLEGRRDPLREVAAHFAAQANLLCLDEFFVADIGDAMILAGLLRHLFDAGVTVVTTSNIEPAGLYRDGLQRARFVPAIGLLERHCEIVALRSTHDYRLRALTQAGVYFTPLGAAAEQGLESCFARMAPGSRRPEAQITVNGRDIAVKRRADGIIWFDFDALCAGPRAVADYIELAQSFKTVLVSDVPRFGAQCENEARRFVHLVDEFYDRGVNLVLSAAAPIGELYAGERLAAEFARTQSRLIEMQSSEYLAGPHRH